MSLRRGQADFDVNLRPPLQRAGAGPSIVENRSSVMWSSRSLSILAAVSLLAAIEDSTAAHAASLPKVGCYKRDYDSKHLLAHKLQYVRKITLGIEPLRPEQIASAHGDIFNNADLRIWVKGSTSVFETFSVCREKDGGYECTGHDRANEHQTCKENTPGVHNCRTPARAETFRIEQRPEGVLITVPVGLELDAGETGPYLNLMFSDRQNSKFLLSSAGACRQQGRTRSRRATQQ